MSSQTNNSPKKLHKPPRHASQMVISNNKQSVVKTFTKEVTKLRKRITINYDETEEEPSERSGLESIVSRDSDWNQETHSIAPAFRIRKTVNGKIEMKRVTTSIIEVASIEAKKMTTIQKSRMAKILREDTLKRILEAKREMKENLRQSVLRKRRKNCRLLRLCCSKVPPRIIISYKNRLRRAWEVVPTILSLYNALMIPLNFSFALPYQFHRVNLVIDILLDFVFLLDNFLLMLTTYENKNGFEVSDPYRIFIHYTRSWRFVFDTLSLLGMSFFTKIHTSLRQFQLFKATRVFRINSMINKSRQPIHIKGILKIGKLVFFLILYLHWVACIWNLSVVANGPDLFFVDENALYHNIWGEILYDADGSPVEFKNETFVFKTKHFFREDDWDRFTANDGIIDWQAYNERWDGRSKQWYSPIDFFDPEDQILHSEEMTTLFRYMTQFYYSLINLGLGEIAPVNSEEYGFLVCSMILSSLIFQIIFGEIITIFAMINSLSMQLEEERIRMNSVMDNIQMTARDRYELYENYHKCLPSRLA